MAAPAMAWLGLVAGLGMAPGEAGPSRLAARPCARGRGAGGSGRGLAGACRRSPRVQIERAVPRFGDDPVAALHGLERARELNRLSDRPDVIAGALTSQAGDLCRSAPRAAAVRSARDAGDWYTHAQLGVLELEAGRRGRGAGGVRRARGG